jgi:ketosteroid isomerase-like protein
VIVAILFFLLNPESGLAATGPDSLEATRMTELAKQVRAAETAFARTMADRDLKAFTSFVDDEAVFFGGEGALRGQKAIVEAWSRFFEGETAPFSWEPETVEVLDSGTLALSSGPVRNPEGKEIATFNSLWRKNPEGVWKVVFDKGSPVCEP